MTLFEKLFKPKKQSVVSSATTVQNLFTPTFNKVSMLDSDVFMSCVYAHARHASKFVPKHYLKDVLGDAKINRVLGLRPNPVMSAPVFWESVAICYVLYTNAFVYLDFDNTNTLSRMWLLNPAALEVKADDNGKVYLRFMLNGQEVTCGLDRIFHIARNVNPNEMFGDGNRALNQVLKVINANYQGIEQAIKTSAYIRFIVQNTGLVNDQIKEDRARKFAEDFLGENSNNLIYVDGATNVIPVSSNAKYSNATEMKLFDEKIYNFLGINEKILNGSYNEEEWQAYYESSLAPLANKIASELTFKLFTEKELSYGNEIVVNSELLQMTSLKTKVSMLNTIKELGVLSINDVRKLIGFTRLEDGDKRLVSLNYINADKQDEYQLGKLGIQPLGEPKEPEEDKNEDDKGGVNPDESNDE